jgi:hypothetical protein
VNREQLEHAIRAAGAISGDRELYVIGSQSILGPFPQAHPDLCRSMEVDIAPKNFPEREAIIEGSIGELSPFHETFGFYVDGIDLRTITLPAAWERRVIIVENPNTNGCQGLCLDPGDLAASKLAAGRPKDFAYLKAMLRERVVTVEILERRLEAMSSLTREEQDELRGRVSILLGPQAPRRRSR